MATCIRLQHVSVQFDSVSALNDVNLEIPNGKIIGILGPSGAGKTTLMRAIVGRRRVQSGSIDVLGLPAGSSKLRGRIGYMPQSPSLYPDLTVTENLRYFVAMLGVPKSGVATRLAEVDLAAQAGQLVATLSGGQKSRLSLAIALLGKPELLVLDEPTVGVDPVLRQQLWQIFRTIAARGVTILVSSHVMDEASRCNDLLLIRSGEVLAHGTPDALCAQTHTRTVEAAFLTLVEAAK